MGMTTLSRLFNILLSFLKKYKLYPFAFQLQTLGLLIFLLYGLTLPAGFSEVNQGMIVFWHIWWPAIPLLILFTGRLWCTICPFSALASLINRLVPYRLADGGYLERVGLLSAFLIYLLIVVLDAVLKIEFYADITLLMISGFLGLMVIMTLFFDYGAFCRTACPFGLFSRIYGEYSFVRLAHTPEICRNCNRTSWVPLPGQESDGTAGRREKRDWRYRVECFKKCRSGSMFVSLGNPFQAIDPGREYTFAEVVIPVLLFMIFSLGVVMKGPWYPDTFSWLQDYLSLGFSHYVVLTVLLVMLLSTVAVKILSNVAGRTAGNRKELGLVLTGMVPMLLFFHIGLVADEFRGAFQDLALFPAKGSIQSISYLMLLMGLVVSVRRFFRSGDDGSSIRPVLSSGGSILLVVVIIGSVLGAYFIISLLPLVSC